MLDVPLQRPTTWQHDILDQTVRTIEPPNRISKATYDVSVHPRFPGFQTLRATLVDPNGKIREEHRDSQGRLVAVVQRIDGRSLVTAYGYQPTGELVSIRDALDRQTQLEYDLA